MKQEFKPGKPTCPEEVEIKGIPYCVVKVDSEDSNAQSRIVQWTANLKVKGWLEGLLPGGSTPPEFVMEETTFEAQEN